MIEHYCVEHKTVFFKKGGMKGYAHPIENEEGKATGGWCNEPKREEKPSEPQPVMSKDDWSVKDRIERKSIERQTALKSAVEVAKILGVEKVTTEKIIATAKLFEAYLEGEKSAKLQPKNHLVEEAKKLGATNVKATG